MSKEEKINKIIEMQKELFLLNKDELSDKEIDDLYVKVKFALETMKELIGKKEG